MRPPTDDGNTVQTIATKLNIDALTLSEIVRLADCMGISAVELIDARLRLFKN
jgi:hypothetical protein